MKRTLLSLLLGLCLATLAQAATPSVEEQIKTFQAKASAALDKRAQSAVPNERGNYALYAGGSLAQLSLRWQNNPASQEFEQAVTQVVTMTGNDPEILKAANELLSAVKADRDERIAAFRTELKELLGKTGAACLAAKSPADLDKALEALAPYRENNYASQRQVDPAGWQRGASAHRFVMRWQDYLAEVTSRRENRQDRITSILNELANMADSELMPRSRILALMPAPAGSPNTVNPSSAAVDPSAEISAILGKLDEPSQLPDAINKLRQLRGSSYNANNQSVDEIIGALNNLVDLQGRLKDGVIAPGLFSENGRSLSPSPRISSENREILMELRRKLLLSAAGNYLKSSGVAPKAAEPLESYIHRVAAQAVKQDDWQLVRSALEVYRSSISNVSAPQWLSSDIESIGYYLAARNQETAGLHAQAISSYQRVLRGSGRYIPAKSIGERLDQLKKSHPEAFEEAARLPVESYNNTYPRYPQPNMPRPMTSTSSDMAPQVAPAPPRTPAIPRPIVIAPAPVETAAAPAAPTAPAASLKEAPPATAALIKRNLRTLRAAADQYCLEHGVAQVVSSQLYGPEKNKYISEIKPVAGEDYSALLIKEGVPFSVTTADGATVVWKE